MCPTSSNYCFIQLLFIALHHSPPHPHPLLSEKHTHLCRIDENSHNRSGGSVMARAPPRGPGWGACLTSLWPYSVSPPAWCRLAPTWGGAHGGNPSLPHLFNCISSFPYQSTTQQGKWREGKLKFTNRWEAERKRETQGSGSTASQRCATKPHFHMRMW